MIPNIRHERMRDGFDKYHVDGFPRSVVFHEIDSPDIVAPHNHPWGFTAFVIYGGYIERVFTKDNLGIWHFEDVARHEGQSFMIHHSHIHKIIHLYKEKSVTVVLPVMEDKPWQHWDIEDKAYSKRLQFFGDWQDSEKRDLQEREINKKL